MQFRMTGMPTSLTAFATGAAYTATRAVEEPLSFRTLT